MRRLYLLAPRLNLGARRKEAPASLVDSDATSKVAPFVYHRRRAVSFWFNVGTIALTDKVN